MHAWQEIIGDNGYCDAGIVYINGICDQLQNWLVYAEKFQRSLGMFIIKNITKLFANG